MCVKVADGSTINAEGLFVTGFVSFEVSVSVSPSAMTLCVA